MTYNKSSMLFIPKFAMKFAKLMDLQIPNTSTVAVQVVVSLALTTTANPTVETDLKNFLTSV